MAQGKPSHGFRKQEDKEMMSKLLYTYQDLQSTVCSNEATWHAGKSVGTEERIPMFWSKMKLTTLTCKGPAISVKSDILSISQKKACSLSRNKDRQKQVALEVVYKMN